MKIVSGPTASIHISKLKDGDIARIDSWNGEESYVGRIVQKVDKRLITLGKGYGESWGDITLAPFAKDSFRLTVLPKGTVLEI